MIALGAIGLTAGCLLVVLVIGGLGWLGPDLERLGLRLLKIPAALEAPLGRPLQGNAAKSPQISTD